MARFLKIPVGPSTNSTWSSVAANGSNVVAVASSGQFRVARSTDSGATWTFIAPGAGMDNKAWSHVAVQGSTYVAVASSGGTNHIMYSANSGASWTLATTVITDALFCVASDGTRFVAVGSGTNSYKSTDGITWTSVVYPAGGLTYRSIVWSGTTWVACTDGGAAGTSFITGNAGDVTTWTNAANSPAGAWIEVVRIGSSMLGITSSGGTNGAVVISQDGTTTYTLNNNLTAGLYQAACSDGTTAVVFNQYAVPSSRIITTANGSTFTTQAVPDDGGNLWIGGASTAANNFVIVSRSGPNNRALTSTSLTAWTSRNMSYSFIAETNAPILLNIENFITMRPTAQDTIQIQMSSSNAGVDTATLTFGADAYGVTHEIIMDAIVKASGSPTSPMGYIDVPALPDGRFIDFNATIIS